MKKGRRFGDIVSNVYLILLSIVAVFPLLWLLVSAFKSSSEMLNNPTKIWPIQWTLANFKTVLFTLKFTVNIRNSLIIAGSTTVVAIIISSLAAYGVVRFFPEHYCVHANKEIDDDRTRIYHSTEMDGAIQYGHPGKKPPMWLNSIMNAEMEFFNGVMHGDPIPDEFKPLMTGEAARAAIATADAATLSLRENRKVSVEEVMK